MILFHFYLDWHRGAIICSNIKPSMPLISHYLRRSLGWKIGRSVIGKSRKPGKIDSQVEIFCTNFAESPSNNNGKREEIEYLPTEHFDILPCNMSIPAGVSLLLPQSPWFSNGAKGLGRWTFRYFWDVTKMPPVQSILLCFFGISHHGLILKWVPHHFACKFNSFHTNGTWLKHKTKNTAFLKGKIVVRFSIWQKKPSEADPL